MYLDHFSLTEFPFGITPDTRFTFESKAQREAIETFLRQRPDEASDAATTLARLRAIGETIL